MKIEIIGYKLNDGTGCIMLPEPLPADTPEDVELFESDIETEYASVHKTIVSVDAIVRRKPKTITN